MKPPVFNPDWPDDVIALYKHDMQEIWDRSTAPQVWNQYHNQIDLYLSLAGTEKRLDVLDVGCAQGTLALLLAESGHRVWAVDIRQKFLDYAKLRYTHGEIHFICSNVLEMDFDRAFDLIYANQLIEHLVYPSVLVKHLAIFLNPGGQLVVTTPNGAYFKNKLPNFKELKDPKKYEHKQFSADGGDHFFAYLEWELREIFLEAGFNSIQIKYFETPWISGHVKIRYLHTLAPIWLLRALDQVTLRFPTIAKKIAHQIMIIGCQK